jgi:hypothetical protein
VLYDLVSAAQKRIVLVTFAAHRVPHLCAHLTRAVDRGVELTLIVESEDEPEAQLTLDAIAAFKPDCQRRPQRRCSAAIENGEPPLRSPATWTSC